MRVSENYMHWHVALNNACHIAIKVPEKKEIENDLVKIKKDAFTTRKYQSSNLSTEQQNVIRKAIQRCLSDGILKAARIYRHLVKEQSRKKEKVIPYYEDGTILSESAFRRIFDSVRYDKNLVHTKETTQLQKYTDMFRYGFSIDEIADTFDLTRDHICKYLTRNGVKEKRKYKKRDVKNTDNLIGDNNG